MFLDGKIYVALDDRLERSQFDIDKTISGFGDLANALYDNWVNFSRIYEISTVDLSSWKNKCTLFLVDFTLSTYHSKLVLIGGKMEIYQSFWEVRDSLLVSSDGVNWCPSLPPVPTKRYQATAVNGGSPEYLIVAGGRGISHEVLVSVEVLVEDQWSVIEPLPFPYSGIRSYCIHNGNLILTDGEELSCSYDSGEAIQTWRHIYCSLESLMVACTQSPAAALESGDTLWKQYLSNRAQFSSFGGLLIHFNQSFNINMTLSVQSPINQSWVGVGNFEYFMDLDWIDTLTIHMPTGELVVISCNANYFITDVSKVTIRGKKLHAVHEV